MTPYHQPSGLKPGLPLLIDPHWLPEQLRAVIERLDDCRDRIWTHYETVLRDHYRQEHISSTDLSVTPPTF